MKAPLFALSILLLAGCISNKPKCSLPPDQLPFPPAHRTPPARTWSSPHGTLPYSQWFPKVANPKGVVIIIGGWDTVTSDYPSLTRALVARGYAVYASENRSFKYGPRKEQGDSRDWHRWVEDVTAFSKFVQERHPGVPHYWYGQSFGAVEALASVCETTGSATPRGVILESPAFAAMLKEPMPVTEALLSSVGWYRFPHLRVMEWKKLAITEDPLRNCAWMLSEDRLRRGYKIRFVVQFARMGYRARQIAPDPGPPVLALWGGRDRLAIAGDESRRGEYHQFMEHELDGGNATHCFVPEGAHVLTEGAKKDIVISAILNWLARH